MNYLDFCKGSEWLKSLAQLMANVILSAIHLTNLLRKTSCYSISCVPSTCNRLKGLTR